MGREGLFDVYGDSLGGESLLLRIDKGQSLVNRKGVMPIMKWIGI